MLQTNLKGYFKDISKLRTFFSTLASVRIQTSS